jgi:hypothetical protein
MKHRLLKWVHGPVYGTGCVVGYRGKPDIGAVRNLSCAGQGGRRGIPGATPKKISLKRTRGAKRSGLPLSRPRCFSSLSIHRLRPVSSLKRNLKQKFQSRRCFTKWPLSTQARERIAINTIKTGAKMKFPFKIRAAEKIKKGKIAK